MLPGMLPLLHFPRRNHDTPTAELEKIKSPYHISKIDLVIYFEAKIPANSRSIFCFNHVRASRKTDTTKFLIKAKSLSYQPCPQSYPQRCLFFEIKTSSFVRICDRFLFLEWDFILARQSTDFGLQSHRQKWTAL